jgi:hypothetical protein
MQEKSWRSRKYGIRLRVFTLRDDGRGVSCDERGVVIGRACPLVFAKRAPGQDRHFVVRSAEQVRLLLKFAYGERFDADSRLIHLRRAAEALNQGDVDRAMVATLMMRLPDLPDDTTSERLAKAHHILRHNYDADQPRDARGRWTRRLPPPRQRRAGAARYYSA